MALIGNRSHSSTGKIFHCEVVNRRDDRLTQKCLWVVTKHFNAMEHFNNKRALFPSEFGLPLKVWNSKRFLFLSSDVRSGSELTAFHRRLTTPSSWLTRCWCSVDVSLSKYIDRPLLFNTRTCWRLSTRLSSLSYGVPRTNFESTTYSVVQHTHSHTRLTALSVLYSTHTHIHPFNGPVQDYPGEPVPERRNQSGFYWSKRQWVAVASAGPYASLHLAPDR